MCCEMSQLGLCSLRLFGCRCLFSSRCFLGRCCGSSGFSLSGSLGCFEFGFLLGYFLSLGLVYGLLGFKTLLDVKLFLAGHVSLQRVNLSLFLGFPSLETLLCFGFVKSAFLYTALEVLHEHHTFLRED